MTNLLGLSTETTLYGSTIPTSMSAVTLAGGGTVALQHNWQADASGLFHTVDGAGAPITLAGEWQALYARLLVNDPTLTAIQRLEANAEAVFENTGLKNLSAAQQQVDREDVQREYDAMDAAMRINQAEFGSNPNQPLVKSSYLALETTMQGNAQLSELAVQGHGLNSPPATRYNGYTNDFQNNVDQTTLYVGGGLNNNQRAIADFFDDSVLSHTPFPTVWQGGHLEQLNQNAAAEDTLEQAVVALDDSMYFRTFKASDFSQTAIANPPKYVSAASKLYEASEYPSAPAGMETTLSGNFIPTDLTGVTFIDGFTGATTPASITVTLAHEWIADASGKFVLTNADQNPLAAEWQGLYARALAGDQSLTAIQHLEANAEAVFENTGLAKLSASQLETDREDVQREFDAMDAAIRIDAKMLGISTTAMFTRTSYLAIEHTIQASPLLAELSIQGHGLNNPPTGADYPSTARYRGYTNDFQNNVDQVTRYVGGGLNSGNKAIADFFDDNLLSHTPFATVARNGALTQLNQNGNAETQLDTAITALNANAFQMVLHKTDFYAPTVAPAGQITTLYGYTISNHIDSLTMQDGTTVSTQYIWQTNGDGLFRAIDRTTGKAADLAADWGALYKSMLSGATLTAEQRQEANAEIIFESTGLAKLSAADQARDREDLQREFDAIAAAMAMNADVLGISSSALLTEQSYLALEHTLQDSPVLQELAIQGHGLNNPPAVRYRGYTNDFQNNVDQTTLFIGGGLNNNQKAIADFLDDSVLSHVPFPTIVINGRLIQLNQNGNAETALNAAVVALDDTLFLRSYKAADFSQTAVANPAKYVSLAQSTVDAAFKVTASAGQVVTLTGSLISSTLNSVTVTTGFDATGTPNGNFAAGAPNTLTVALDHSWIANAKSGLFQLANAASNPLATEWTALYARALAGDQTLTAVQRLEANAEAVFENTGLANLSAARQETDREDLQREFDAIDAAMTIDAALLGIPQSAAFTRTSYISLEHTLQSTPALEELAIQGHGLNNSGKAKYAGYTNDFQNNVDQTTLYVGGGNNNGQKAIADFLDDSLLSHVPFPTVFQGGRLIQLNQNGAAETRLDEAVAALDDNAYWRVLRAKDFLKKG